MTFGYVYRMLDDVDVLGLDMLWLMDLNACMVQNGVEKYGFEVVDGLKN